MKMAAFCDIAQCIYHPDDEGSNFLKRESTPPDDMAQHPSNQPSSLLKTVLQEVIPALSIYFY
jgi:hypothetical protein